MKKLSSVVMKKEFRTWKLAITPNDMKVLYHFVIFVDLSVNGGVKRPMGTMKTT
jgi:hypothetical protein